MRRAAPHLPRHQRPERGEQLRRARLHDGAREPRSQPLPPGGAALRRGVRRFDGGGGPGELHAGAPRPALAQLAHPTAGRHLSHRPLLRPPAGAGRPAESRPAHLRGHPDVRHHDPVREPDAAERLDHRRRVLGRPLDDQPDAVPRRHRLRGDRLRRHDPARPPARTPQLPAGRPRGGLSRRSSSTYARTPSRSRCSTASHGLRRGSSSGSTP